jgi:hypothetical protein
MNRPRRRNPDFAPQTALALGLYDLQISAEQLLINLIVHTRFFAALI